MVPRVVAAKETETEREGEPCSICYEALLPGEEVRRLPCLHVFHRGCIDRWLKIRPTCPLDNQRLEDMLEGRRTTRTHTPLPPPTARPAAVPPRGSLPVPL